MAENAKVPVRDNVGAALRFVRENWRFVLIVAAIGALVQGVVAVLVPNLIGAVALLFVSACIYAALTYAALSAPQGVRQRVVGDGARVAAAVGMVGFLMSIVFVMMLFVAMSILIAPYGEEVRAAGEDRVAIEAILNRAIEAQPGTLFWLGLVAGVITFALTSRFYVAAPASVDQQRIAFVESWRLTKGNLLRIAAARLMLLAPALILVGALQSLLAAGLGAPGGNLMAMMALAQSNPVAFVLFTVLGSFLQIALFSALEAGLSANLYRSLKQPPPPPVA